MKDSALTLEDIVENISQDELHQVRTFEDALALANQEILELISSNWDLDLLGTDLSLRDRLAEEIWKRSPATRVRSYEPTRT